MDALKREVVKLHQNNIKLVMIGDRSHFDASLITQIEESEQLTEKNTGLVLTIAANYSGVGICCRQRIKCSWPCPY